MSRVTLEPRDTHRLDLAGFVTGYRAEVVRCIDKTLGDLPRALPLLRTVLDRPAAERGAVYFLGNGGSSAIARTLALTAEATIGAGTRWVGAWDQHRLAAASTRLGFDAAAVALLRRDNADARDLVVLISGSGNSRNLLALARHCLERDIPLLTITGRTGGALAHLDPHGLRVDSTDQQVIEDVAHAAGLALLRLLAQNASHQDLRADLVRAVTVAVPWMQALTDVALTAIAAGARIAVLAPEGGGIALSAEHVAHNLRWDLVHDRPDHIRVIDGTSLCDDTGMANDTGTLGLPVVRTLDGDTDHDVFLVFADDPMHPAVRLVRESATAQATSVLGCYQRSHAVIHGEIPWTTGIATTLTPLTAQTVGHLLLRSLRAGMTVRHRELDDADSWSPVAPQLTLRT